MLKFRLPWCSSRCSFSSSLRMKILLHRPHRSTCSFSCTYFTCICRIALRLNRRPQIKHLKPFSPVWLNRWARRLLLWMNVFWQNSQANGRSSRCVYRCRFSVPFSAKSRSHSGHRYGRSFVCTRRCLTRALFDGNRFSQCSQGNGFTLLCTRSWISSSDWPWNAFSQCRHLYRFGRETSSEWLRICWSRLSLRE